MTQFEKRLAAVEAKAGMSDSFVPRIYLQPLNCPDVPAWERACRAEATRDRVQPLIVLFVRPGDVVPTGALH